MRATAFGQFTAKDLQCTNSLLQEVWRSFYDESSWVSVPCLLDLFVDHHSIFGGLNSQRISMVVIFDLWCAQMDHRAVASDLLINGRFDWRPQVPVPDPVGASIDCSSMANDNRWKVGICSRFELTLNIKDCALRGLPE